MRIKDILAASAALLVILAASTPVCAEEQASLLIQDRVRATWRDRPDYRDYQRGPIVWTVASDGSRAISQFEIPKRMKGSLEFAAVSTPARPERVLTIRLEPLDPAFGRIEEVFIPTLEARGPRLSGRVSRSDETTFQVNLDPKEAANDVKAISLASKFNIEFRFESGKLGKISIEREEAGALALQRLFPPLGLKDNQGTIFLHDLAEERSEADVRKFLFGASPAGSVCFARLYDDEHLRAHPLQGTVEFALRLRMKERDGLKPLWTFSASAILRNGVRAGVFAGEFQAISFRPRPDLLHHQFFFDARDGAVEDGQTSLTLSMDGKQAWFSPLDEMGVGDPGVMWPASADVSQRAKRERDRARHKDELYGHTDNDDQSFRLDRAEPSVCERIERAAQLRKTAKPQTE